MEKSENKPNMPIEVALKKDESYLWCTCGKTTDKPFCDGSHAGSDFTPLEFSVEKDRKAFICSCRRTKNPPFCDSSHEGDISYIMSELVK
jgi:CDGSH-type Zn-finger protein